MAGSKSRTHQGTGAAPVDGGPWQWNQTFRGGAGHEAAIFQTGHRARKKAVYTGISFFLHIILVIWLSGIGLSPASRPVPDVFMVDLVPARPSASSAPEPVKARAIPMPEKKQAPEVKSLSSVEKEKVLPRHEAETPLEVMEQEPGKAEEAASQDPPAAESGMPAEGAAPPAALQGSADGDPGESARLIALWKIQVKGIMDKAWETPSFTPQVDASLKTTYVLKISRNGDLLDKKILASSGNPSYDRTVQLALEGAQRFPAPPEALMAGQATVEITMSFSPPSRDK